MERIVDDSLARPFPYPCRLKGLFDIAVFYCSGGVLLHLKVVGESRDPMEAGVDTQESPTI
jgi:hypothetical protein